MKLLLQVIGWAAIAAGLLMFFLSIRADVPNLIALSWIVSGVVSSALFLGMAHIIGMLEELRDRQGAAYRQAQSQSQSGYGGGAFRSEE